MEDSDWRLLQLETDRQLNGMLSRILQKYQLADEEVRFFCLIWAGIPTSRMYHLSGHSDSYSYRQIRSLLKKLGIKHHSLSYKSDLQTFMDNLK